MRAITDITPSTTVCALIGSPVAHSLSPAMHNRAFAELGLDYVYVAFRVEDVAGAVAGMRAFENFRGMSVTIPHKVSIIDLLDEVAEVDRRIGSVNTVVKENGRLKGCGSDGPGARQALIDAGVETRGKNVTILGSGGAARAIAFTLAEAKPAALFLLGIIEPELQALTHDVVTKTGMNATCTLLDPKNLEARLAESQVLIHCTPVGMHPNTNASVVPPSLLHRDLVVMDIVYNPLNTRLLAEAEERGLKTISGMEMFVNQAVMQFELWTGRTAPRAVMREVVLTHLGPAVGLDPTGPLPARTPDPSSGALRRVEASACGPTRTPEASGGREPSAEGSGGRVGSLHPAKSGRPAGGDVREAMNLVLIGYRGTGKSTVAKLLAEKLGMDVVSLDQEIVRRAGRPVPEIVAEHGWSNFRDLESTVTKEISERDNVVIDAGGGVILRRDNVERLRRGGKLFWLRASVPVIVARIEAGSERPPLTAGKSFTEEVEEVLRDRTPLYDSAADYQIDTDALSPQQVADEVARLYSR